MSPSVLLALALSLQDPPDVTTLDLEDLLKARVATASRKDQPLLRVPAAVTVIRGDDLRRMGVRHLAEALRAVPGMQVARADANTWAVSARGFNSVVSNKLLVLVDGRSVYSPLHSGVFWEVQDTNLADIDRIEVIRGPGGALWGANAINGIVNVITRPATQTPGGLLQAGAGTEEKRFALARYGFAGGEDAAVRVWANHFAHDDAALGSDPDHQDHDEWFMSRGGVRLDARTGDRDRLFVTAEAYDGETREQTTHVLIPAAPTDPVSGAFNQWIDLRGGHLNVRWERTLGERSHLAVKAYYDHTVHSTEIWEAVLHTGDVEILHRFRPLAGHDLNWGVGYRHHIGDFRGRFPLDVDEEDRRLDIASVFVEDEVTLVEDRLSLTLGSRVEHNDFTGVEVQPNVRAAWTPDDRHMAWAAVTRAVRTPSVIDDDLRFAQQAIPGAPPTVVTLLGSDDFRSEELVAFEAGYRFRPHDLVSIDVAAFLNLYDDLRTQEPGAPFASNDPPPPHAVAPFVFDNKMAGRTWGAELSAHVQPAAGWLLHLGYAHLRMNLRLTEDSLDTRSEAAERQNPRHTAWIRSALDLPGGLELDVMGRYVSGLAAFDVDSYVEADVRLAWRDPASLFEVAVVGQNLARSSHEEFGPNPAGSARNEMERGVYLVLTWRF